MQGPDLGVYNDNRGGHPRDVTRVGVPLGGHFAKKCDDGQLAFAADKTFYIIYGYFYTFIPKK